MNDAVIGLIAILVGLLACLAGYAVFRVVLPILGFFVGLGLGAQLAARVLNEPYLSSPLAWIIAIVIGLVVATIAFVWWYVSVALTIGGLGYAIGYGGAVGLGVSDSTMLLVAGVVVAVIFALAALLLRVPIFIVILVTAFWGASALIGGVLVLLNRIQPDQLRNGTVDVVIRSSTLWLAVWVGLGIIGVLVQWFTTPRGEQPGTSEPALPA
ncbi:MAG TPA: DUF4203 domain-containing protein [Candidatus Limnocylindria bacterium]|nr:DUF4203 domain-containing protein [Candidatus Limnocylindria bacterium]